jgi:hypothetical protein
LHEGPLIGIAVGVGIGNGIGIELIDPAMADAFSIPIPIPIPIPTPTPTPTLEPTAVTRRLGSAAVGGGLRVELRLDEDAVRYMQEFGDLAYQVLLVMA